MLELEAALRLHFEALDRSLDALSRGSESQLSDLPSWVLCHRLFEVGTTEDRRGAVVRVTPTPAASDDTFIFKTLTSADDMNAFVRPFRVNVPLDRLHTFGPIYFGDAAVFDPTNPLLPPAMDFRGLVLLGDAAKIASANSADEGRKEALDLWNRSRVEGPPGRSYVREVRSILGKARSLPRRKSFLERRIHRFLDHHGALLLPPHRRRFFEHRLRLGSREVKADFVLEREAGTPALLVELESPVHNVVKANGDLSQPVFHAIQQINEWVAIIDSDPATNAASEMAFLVGPKQRLVVIGRGLEHKARLLETRFSDTLIWTYDLLVDEARRRLNGDYRNQCGIVGLPPAEPF
jgi:hypothetical protein